MIAETILDATWEWLVQLLGVAEDRVLLAPRGAEPAVYPTAPCLVVDLTNLGTPQGTAGRADVPAGRVTFVQLVGTVEIMGYGTATQDWLLQVMAAADAARLPGFDFVALSPILDASVPIETGIEQRYSLELTLQYAYKVTSPQVAALSINTTTPLTGAP